MDERSARAYGPTASHALEDHGPAARDIVARRKPVGPPSAPRAFEDPNYEAQLRALDPTIGDADKTVAVVALADLRVRQVGVELDENAWSSDEVAEDLHRRTLPLVPPAAPVASFDEQAHAWVLRSPGAALEIRGRYHTAVVDTGPGTYGFGFVISAQPSRVEVLDIDGLLVLVDGHHRAVELYRAGVREIPVLVTRASRDDLVIADGLSAASILSSRPAFVADYLDDDVAVDVDAPGFSRSIIIQASDVKMPRV